MYLCLFGSGWFVVGSAPIQYWNQWWLVKMCLILFRPPWASCQIRKSAGTHAPGMPGTFSPPPRLSDPDMHHGTCGTHVPWCMPGSLTSGFLWSRRWGGISRHSRRMRNPQCCVSGKRPTCPVLGSKCWNYFLNRSPFIITGIELSRVWRLGAFACVAPLPAWVTLIYYPKPPMLCVCVWPTTDSICH